MEVKACECNGCGEVLTYVMYICACGGEYQQLSIEEVEKRFEIYDIIIRQHKENQSDL